MPLSDTLTERLVRLPGAPENTDRPRIVIDTNVLLDLLFWHDASAEPLRRALETGTVAAVFDDEALKEAGEVLGRPQFLAGDDEAVFALLEAWSRNAQRVPEEAVAASAKTLAVRCRDPLDQKFLVLAAASGASWLATKDKLLFKAGKKLRRFGVEPIRPADFGRSPQTVTPTQRRKAAKTRAIPICMNRRIAYSCASRAVSESLSPALPIAVLTWSAPFLRS